MDLMINNRGYVSRNKVFLIIILVVFITSAFYFIDFDEYGIDLNANNGDIENVNLLEKGNLKDFAIIEIVDAEHLDPNKKFISNIYNEAHKLDDVWTENIPSGHYIRVKFEKELTAKHHIKIYPMITSGSPVINVYESSNNFIGQFKELIENNYNKLPLDNLVDDEDSFDMLVSNGGIRIDSIIDPSVSTCGTLSTAGAVYDQTANIIPNSSASPCIVIGANNITYNGAGFWIANTTFNNTGIYSSGRLNITIQNVNVTVNKTNSLSGYGLYLASTNRSLIADSIFGFSYNGIFLNSRPSNNTFRNITANSNRFDGIVIPTSGDTASYGNEFNNIIANNNTSNGINIRSPLGTFTNVTTSFNGGAGILMTSHLAKIINATANSNGNYGFYASIASHGNITGFTANNNSIGGIILDATNNMTFSNGIINGSRFYGINLFDDTAGGIETLTDNKFSYINITSTNASGYDLFLNFDASDPDTTLYAEYNHFINTYIGNYSIVSSNGNIIEAGIKLVIEDTRFGEIKFLDYVNGSGTNLTADVRILNNSATVRSNINIGLNKTANVTLRGLSISDNFGILRDGASCSSAICYNFTSLNAGTVVFNVSYWTNYSINHTNISPNVTIVSPTAQTYTTSTYLVNITINEPGFCNYSLDGGDTNNTLTADSLNRTFNSTESGGSNGGYVLWAYCHDVIGNTNYTTNVSFTISVSSGSSGSSSGGGSSGGGGGAPSGQSYNISANSLNEGYINDIGINDKYFFVVYGENHNLTLNSYNFTSAVVTIRSEPLIINLKRGEDRNIDINSDELNDLLLRYDGMTTGRARLFIQTLVDNVSESGNVNETENPDMLGLEEKRKKALMYQAIYLGAFVFLLVVVLVIAKIVRNRRERVLVAFNKKFAKKHS